VHRDLKPSNVLVTPDGQAHLLDFGIAKLLDDVASPDDRLTQAGGRVLTPRYASPEQVRGDPVTVASDVYSLGVLLYELLAGTSPYALQRRSLGALEDAVLAGEPPLASGRVRDRPTAKALHGELDSILGKALKREPALRYATADALAQDIDRYLKGERVLAQPDSFGYRLSKVLRRHRAAFAATAAVLVAVLGGAGMSIVQAKRASDALERARVVKEFVVDVFKVNERGSAGNNGLRQLPVELLLDRGAKLIETKFPGQPQLQAELYGVVGGIFADMGANQQAADYATRQIEALVAIDASDEEQAKATMLLGEALLAGGRMADARVRADRALALSERFDDLRPAALVLLARIARFQGDLPAARALLDRAERDLAKSATPTPARAQAKATRARLLLAENRFEEAIPLYLSAIDMALQAEGPLSPTAIDVRLRLQWIFVNNDRGEESKPHREAALWALRASGGAGEIRAALEESRTIANMFGQIPRQTTFEEARETIERNRSAVAARGALVPASINAQLDRALGRVYAGWGDFASAAPLSDSSYAVLASKSDALYDRWELAASQASLATVLGRHDQAARYYSDAIELRKQSGDGKHPWAAGDYIGAALNFTMQGHFDEAEKVLASAPQFEELRGGGVGSGRYADIIPKTLATIKLVRGDAAAALKLLPPEERDQQAPLGYDDIQLRGEILCAAGRRAEGLPRLERAIDIQEHVFYAHEPGLARARAVAGLCALQAGQRSRAESLAAQARQAFAVQPDVSPFFKVPLKELERKLAIR